jgi:hypothetical protein
MSSFRFARNLCEASALRLPAIGSGFLVGDPRSDPDAFEVLNIVEHRIPNDDDGQPGSWDSAKQHVLFLVEWKNFPLRKDFTWEPLPNLGGCAALLAAYVGNSPALKNLFPEFFSEYPELD